MKWGISMELSIERKIEIEREFAKALCDDMNKKNIVIDAILNSSYDESMYYVYAYIMPFEEMSRDIQIYNSCYGRITDIKFLDYLCTKYGMNLKIISQRLLDVSKIKRHLKENNMSLNIPKEKGKRKYE